MLERLVFVAGSRCGRGYAQGLWGSTGTVAALHCFLKQQSVKYQQEKRPICSKTAFDKPNFKDKQKFCTEDHS